MELREFEKGDWYAWAGCERFTDGSSPLVGEFTDGEVKMGNHGEVEGEIEVTVTVVFDIAGSSAYVEEYGDELHLDDEKMTEKKARKIASQIHRIADLHKLGYKS